jgi:hypothetical protein
MKFVLTGKYMEIADIRGGKPHTGIDLRMPENTILRSIKDGYVDKILHNDKIGNGIVIKDDAGNSYIYGHLNQVKVQGPGQHVYAGQEIGLSGNTGNSSGPHLHFGVKDASGHFVDPTPLGEHVANMSGSNGNWFMDKWNAAGDWVIGKERDFIGHPIQRFLHDMLLNGWNWFIVNLPDIIGYSAIAAGIFIILSAMMGKNILKPLGWFSGAFITALCILGGVKNG